MTASEMLRAQRAAQAAGATGPVTKVTSPRKQSSPRGGVGKQHSPRSGSIPHLLGWAQLVPFLPLLAHPTSGSPRKTSPRSSVGSHPPHTHVHVVPESTPAAPIQRKQSQPSQPSQPAFVSFPTQPYSSQFSVQVKPLPQPVVSALVPAPKPDPIVPKTLPSTPAPAPLVTASPQVASAVTAPSLLDKPKPQPPPKPEPIQPSVQLPRQGSGPPLVPSSVTALQQDDSATKKRSLTGPSVGSGLSLPSLPSPLHC